MKVSSFVLLAVASTIGVDAARTDPRLRGEERGNDHPSGQKRAPAMLEQGNGYHSGRKHAPPPTEARNNGNGNGNGNSGGECSD